MKPRCPLAGALALPLAEHPVELGIGTEAGALRRHAHRATVRCQLHSAVEAQVVAPPDQIRAGLGLEQMAKALPSEVGAQSQRRQAETRLLMQQALSLAYGGMLRVAARYTLFQQAPNRQYEEGEAGIHRSSVVGTRVHLGAEPSEIPSLGSGELAHSYGGLVVLRQPAGDVGCATGHHPQAESGGHVREEVGTTGREDQQRTGGQLDRAIAGVVMAAALDDEVEFPGVIMPVPGPPATWVVVQVQYALPGLRKTDRQVYGGGHAT